MRAGLAVFQRGIDAMDLALNGKVALVTGASQGIGATIARSLAKEGCIVALVARDRDKLDSLVNSIKEVGGRAAAFSCDLSIPANPGTLIAKVIAQLGKLDVLVGNAGTASMGDFFSLTDDDWADGFGVKFFGHMRLARAAWPHLQTSSGNIVFIAGSAGRTPATTSAITGSVNSALLNLTKTLASRGIVDGVRVNAVNPGAIETDRYHVRIQRAMSQTGRSAAEIEKEFKADRGNASVGDAQDIANVVCVLASDRMKHLNGSIIDVDGGKTKTL